MVTNILKKIRLAKKQIKFAQSFEEMLKKKLEQKQKEQELRKQERKQEGQEHFLTEFKDESGQWKQRKIKKPVPEAERTIEEHADATHKSLEQQHNRDKWKATLEKKLIFLQEGRDDSRIHEIRHMLMTILNQPGHTMAIRRDKNFASSILGSDIPSKKASLHDELEKAKRLKEKKERPDLITKKDLSKEELENLQQNISSREDAKRPSHYVGWKRETPEGVVYKLSGGQLKLILDSYEAAIARSLKPQKEPSSRVKTDRPKLKMPDLFPKKEEAPMLSDEDIEDLDLSDFGKVSSIQKAKFAIKKAQNMLTGKKVKVFLDDDKEALERQKLAQGYDIWVTTPEEAIELLKSGNVSHISLDHDLGLEPEDRNGYMVAKFIEDGAYFNTLPRLKWRPHTANQVGYDNMTAALKNADRFWDKHEAETEAN